MKVKFTKSTVAFLSLMLLTACASTSTNELVIPKELLVKVEENESTSFRLKRSYIFNIDLAGEDLNGNLGQTKRSSRELTVVGGEYKLIGSTAEGEFYSGPPFCLTTPGFKAKWCGLFFYKESPEIAYVFYHLQALGENQSVSLGAFDPNGISTAVAGALQNKADIRDLKNYTLMLNYPIELSELEVEWHTKESEALN